MIADRNLVPYAAYRPSGAAWLDHMLGGFELNPDSIAKASA